MSSLSGQFANVKNTFSSWDSCMSKTYCKYPVIVGIVLASLIVLSIVWCFASCLCCGATLCGSCVKCLTCCNCCGACGSRGGGGSKTRHKDDYTQMPPTPYNGYQPQPSPMSYQPPASGPQFAQFDSTKKVHADSLPAMPTWDTARTVRVEDHSQEASGFGNDVEMGRMSPRPAPSRMRGGYNQVPNGPVSPISSPAGYGRFEGQAHPYGSDIGTQRLGQQQTGYSDFEPSPLSPAPTYRTYPSNVGGAAPDRFAHGAISPSPSEYHQQNYFPPTRDQAWSPLPARQQHSTEYHSYHRSLSPPVDNYTPSHGLQPQEQGTVRPPSLLQVGRKPVVGSQREI